MKTLDTRNKIVTYERALESTGRETIWVSGHFDPLLAQHVRDLAGATVPGKRLAVIVTDPPDPLLPLESRARLVAALACVDIVVPRGKAPGGPDEADLRIREEFIQRVRLRSNGAAR